MMEGLDEGSRMKEGWDEVRFERRKVWMNEV